MPLQPRAYGAGKAPRNSGARGEKRAEEHVGDLLGPSCPTSSTSSVSPPWAAAQKASSKAATSGIASRVDAVVVIRHPLRWKLTDPPDEFVGAPERRQQKAVIKAAS